MKTALDTGVNARDGDGKQRLVYLYQRGDYRLADIVEFFQLGKLVETGGADEAVLVLTGKELQTLKTMADTFSFDYEDRVHRNVPGDDTPSRRLGRRAGRLRDPIYGIFLEGVDGDFSNHHFEFVRLGGFFRPNAYSPPGPCMDDVDICPTPRR